MWQNLLKFIVVEVVRALVDIVRDAVALKKKEKEDKLLVEAALKEKDRAKRAAAIRDLLS